MSADRPRNHVTVKIKRILSNVRKAWWVLLIIVGYMVFASIFLGTSCLTASTVGIPCPGCGITRSFSLLVHGDIAGSLYYYPMLMPSLLFIGVYVTLSLVCEQRPRYLDRAMLVMAVILVGVYVVRMIFLFPDSAPMTYNYEAILPRIVQLVQRLF